MDAWVVMRQVLGSSAGDTIDGAEFSDFSFQGNCSKHFPINKAPFLYALALQIQIHLMMQPHMHDGSACELPFWS